MSLKGANNTMEDIFANPIEYAFCQECGSRLILPPLPPNDATIEVECDFYLCQAVLSMNLVWVDDDGIERGFLYWQKTLSGGISEG